MQLYYYTIRFISFVDGTYQDVYDYNLRSRSLVVENY